MGEKPQVGRIEPGLPPLRTPALGELAERLVEQAEINAVLAPGIAGGLENPHVAEPGDLIEQEKHAAIVLAAGLVDGVQQRAENDAGGLWAALQHLERQVDEDIELAGEQVAGPEALAADQAGEGGDGEPGGGVASLAVEAGELLFGDVLQVTSKLSRKAKTVTGAFSVGVFEELLELGN